MAGRYFAESNATNSAGTVIGALQQGSSPTKRLRVTYLNSGSDATSDNAYKTRFTKTSTLATGGTAVTPALRDPADGAASAQFQNAPTGNITAVANAIVLTLEGHQRSTIQWYAAPGSEIIIASSASAGVAASAATVTTSFNQIVNFEWEE